MKKVFWLLALAGMVLLSAAPVLADGDIYVVAAGGGVGTRISSLPYFINNSGSYYVTGNLSCPSGNGITINASDVTLDLMGFTLSGNSASDGLAGSPSNVEVRNGSLSGWNHAIFLTGLANRIINVRAESNTFGIYLFGSGHLVRGCTARNNTDTGINAYDSIISNNIVVTSDGAACGISGYGIISGNKIGGAYNYGINCNDASNIIGNTLFGSGYTTAGIQLPTAAAVVDQNTVFGSGSHYAGGSTATIWAGKSADYPWGNNAGHQ